MRTNEKSLLWNVEQAAFALAISPWTIRLYVRQGKLRAVRLGRRLLLEPDEYQRFLKVCKSQFERRADKFAPQVPNSTKDGGPVRV